MIKTANHFIPIEVKIYAYDQVEQCSDYFEYAKNSKLYYLTLYGISPSGSSACGLTEKKDGYDEVINLSFKDNVLSWLNSCLEQKETIRVAPIREIILQLIMVIRRLTDQQEEGMAMEIQKILESSKENIKSAVEIERSLKECKIDKLREVFERLEEDIEKELGIKKLDNEYDYANQISSRLTRYYDLKGTTYPGISYEYKTKVKKDIDVWLRVEIEQQIFVGFCVPYNGKASGKPMLTHEEIKQFIPDLEPTVNNWWINRVYLPSNDIAESPDFKTLNDAYYNLFDKDCFYNFIKKSVDTVKDLYQMNKIGRAHV